MTNQDIERGRQNAIISYITIIGVIIAFYMNKEEHKKSDFASFHIRQSLGLWLSFIIINLSITRNFDILMLRAAIYVFFFSLIIFGFSNAIGGKSQPVPILGAFYQKIFANLGN